jgi:hypothetical protein
MVNTRRPLASVRLPYWIAGTDTDEAGAAAVD